MRSRSQVCTCPRMHAQAVGTIKDKRKITGVARAGLRLHRRSLCHGFNPPRTGDGNIPCARSLLRRRNPVSPALRDAYNSDRA